MFTVEPLKSELIFVRWGCWLFRGTFVISVSRGVVLSAGITPAHGICVIVYACESRGHSLVIFHYLLNTTRC